MCRHPHRQVSQRRSSPPRRPVPEQPLTGFDRVRFCMTPPPAPTAFAPLRQTIHVGSRWPAMPTGHTHGKTTKWTRLRWVTRIGLLVFGSASCPSTSRDPPARDAEFAEGAQEMSFDCPGRGDELGRDLAVGGSAGGEPGDLELAGSETRMGDDACGGHRSADAPWHASEEAASARADCRPRRGRLSGLLVGRSLARMYASAAATSSPVSKSCSPAADSFSASPDRTAQGVDTDRRGEGAVAALGRSGERGDRRG